MVAPRNTCGRHEREATPPGLWRSLRVAIAATERPAGAWDTFVESLRTRPCLGAAAEDPYWAAVGLPVGQERGRLWLAEHPIQGEQRRSLHIQAWRLSGRSCEFLCTDTDRVRALRVTIAEQEGCCDGQVRLSLEVALHGRDPADTRTDTWRGLENHPELAARVIEHLGCSPGELPLESGDVLQLALPVRDGLTLRHYGYRSNLTPPARMLVFSRSATLSGT